MRIGEVVVLGTSGREVEQFIETICQKVEQKDQNICYGYLPINDQLVLYLYGFELATEVDAVAWDMLSGKTLGYVCLFNWYEPESLNKIIYLLDYLDQHHDVPLILAANVGEQDFPLPESLFSAGITLSLQEKLLFCRVDDAPGCKKALVSLLDIVLDKF